MSVFDYHDYKQCVNEWIGAQPSGGHGQLRQMALYLGVNSVVMSQIFRGNRELSLEQGLKLTQYMGYTEVARDYFLVLVQIARAGSEDLKRVFEKQRQELSQKAQSLKNRIQHQKFSEEDKATFYSQWYYSAIRLGASIPKNNKVGELAQFLNLERALVVRVLEFLIKNKLVIERDGELELGPQVTHVGYDSPFVNRHHTNWRIKGLQAMETVKDSDLFYTGPMALSRQASDEIRSLLVKLVENCTRKAKDSDSETLNCLNIDWFSIGRSHDDFR